MDENRGKKFEQVIRDAFEKVPNTLVVRMPDPTMGYLGVRNFCDFFVFRSPYLYCIECKSIHGNTFPFSNITKNQWEGLLEADKIEGIIAGVIVWWVDHDITGFLDIGDLAVMKEMYNTKSIRYDAETFPQESR